MDLVIVRHARPERIESSDEGPADPELNELGHLQARAVADLLALETVDRIVSSPMRRALQTAAPLAERLESDVEVITDLAEIDHASSYYLPTEELKAEGGDAWQRMLDDPFHEWGDGVGPFRDRVITAFEKLVAEDPGRRVAVFCHGLVTMMWLHHLLGYRDPIALRPEYASITRVAASTTHDVRTVRSINETGHLGRLRTDWV